MNSTIRSTPHADERLYPHRVRDIMTTNLFTVSKMENMRNLEKIFQLQQIRHIPVIDSDYQLLGLITHGDFLKATLSSLDRPSYVEKERFYEQVAVSDIMRTDIITVSPECSLQDAARIMVEHKIGCLPIVSEKVIVGIVTQSDFLKLFI